MIALLLAAIAAASPADAERLAKYRLQPIEDLQKAGEQLQRISIQGPSQFPNAPAITLTTALGGFWSIELNGVAGPRFMSVPVERSVWGTLEARQRAAYAAASATPPAAAEGCDILVLEAVMTKGAPAQRRYVSSCDEGSAGVYAEELADLAARSTGCASKDSIPARGRLGAGCYSAQSQVVIPQP